MSKLLPVEKILPNPQQPRTVFDPAALQDLANSIRENGLQSPILVQNNRDGTYTLVAGERRLRAHKLLSLKTIEANIREPADSQNLLIDAMTENIQRDNMNPVDEAAGYLKMRDEFGMSIVQISKAVGVHRARVDNLLKITKLEKPIQDLIAARRFHHSPEAIDALLSIPAGKIRIEFAQSLSARSATIKMIAASAARLLKAMQDKTIKGAPALVLAKRYARKPSKAAPQWNALKQTGRLPPYELFVKNIEATCAACSLSEIASETTCRDCPVVEFTRRTLETVHA